MRMWGLYWMSVLVFLSAHRTRLGSLIKSLVLRVVTGELWVDLLVLGEEFLGGLGFLGVVVGSSDRTLARLVSNTRVGKLKGWDPGIMREWPMAILRRSHGWIWRLRIRSRVRCRMFGRYSAEFLLKRSKVYFI